LWTAEAGKYTVKAGASSLNIKRTAVFELAAEKVVEKVSKAMTPQAAINKLTK